MITKTVKVKDLEGNEYEDVLYFNLTNAEVIRMEASEQGGLSKQLKELKTERNLKRIIEIFEYILGTAYGEKSRDGRKFVKNEDTTNAFLASESYSAVFEEFIENPAAAAAFINELAKGVGRLVEETPEERARRVREESLKSKGGFQKRETNLPTPDTVYEEPSDPIVVQENTSEPTPPAGFSTWKEADQAAGEMGVSLETFLKIRGL